MGASSGESWRHAAVRRGPRDDDSSSTSGKRKEPVAKTEQVAEPTPKKTPAPAKPKPTGPLQFAPLAPLGTNATTIDFSDDRLAFTLAFSDMEVAVPGAVYRLTLTVEAHTHPQYEGDADGFLNAVAVEAEITP